MLGSARVIRGTLESLGASVGRTPKGVFAFLAVDVVMIGDADDAPVVSNQLVAVRIQDPCHVFVLESFQNLTGTVRNLGENFRELVDVKESFFPCGVLREYGFFEPGFVDLPLVYFLLNASCQEQAIYENFLSLANAVGPIHGLGIPGWVVVGIVHDHSVGAGQSNPFTAGASGNKKDIELPFLKVLNCRIPPRCGNLPEDKVVEGAVRRQW